MATESNQSDFVHTNVRFFYEIAKESYEVMKDEFDSHKRPKPGGEPGWILTWDPDHKSFKKAFVTIVFCGVWGSGNGAGYGGHSPGFGGGD